MAFDTSKFLKRFIQEANKHMQQLSSGIIALENNPDDTEHLQVLFRAAHTLKGSATMMDQQAIAHLSHEIENIFSLLRDTPKTLSKQCVTNLLWAVDELQHTLQVLDDGKKVDHVSEDVLEALQSSYHELQTATTSSTIAKIETADKQDNPQDNPQDSPQDSPKDSPQDSPQVITDVHTDAPVKDAQEEQKRETHSSVEEKKPENSKNTYVEEPAVKPDSVQRSSNSTVKKTEQSVRKDSLLTKVYPVGAEKLNELMRLISENTLWSHEIEKKAQNLAPILQLTDRMKRTVQFCKDISPQQEELHKDLETQCDELQFLLYEFQNSIIDMGYHANYLSEELQESLIRIRMTPISAAFETIPRIVRDISLRFDKQIKLEILGGETELDRQIVDMIDESLLHIIRNAIDHGIEPAAVRKAAGKPEFGTIRVQASYDRGICLLEVSDDGSGIPLEQLKNKALQKGLITEEQAHKMTQTDSLIDLIYYPGLSSNEIITDLSGRGVGMDVVKQHIVFDMKGSITVKTKEGKGTTFSMRLPLSTAIMQIMIFKISGEEIAVASQSVQEVLRIPEKEIIEVVHRPAIRLRNQLIPIITLDNLFKLQSPENKKSEGSKTQLIAIVTTDTKNIGVRIDEVVVQEDYIIYSLPNHLKKNRWISGCIVREDHRVVDLLTTQNLVELAQGSILPNSGIAQKNKEKQKKAINILVVDDSRSTRDIEKSILESYGYSVTLAFDGVDAMHKLQSGNFDIIISDIEMPNMDGFTLTKKLREDPTYMETPIILVTSRDSDHDKRRGISAGADAYIVKAAFDQTNLLQTIESLL